MVQPPSSKRYSLVAALATLVALLSVVVVVEASTRELWINSTSTIPPSNCCARASPCHSFAEAISCVENGDTIIGVSGTFSGSGNVNLTFPKAVLLVSDHAYMQYPNGDRTPSVVIDCAGAPGWQFSLSSSSGSSDLSIMIDGFVFSGCRPASNNNLGGGALLSRSTYGKLQLQNAQFMHNSATDVAGGGGGLGGAIYWAAAFSMSNTSFSNNTAVAAGGAVYLAPSGGTPSLSNIVFDGNSVSGSNATGSALVVSGSFDSLTLSNVTATNNVGALSTIELASTAPPALDQWRITIERCSVMSNTAGGVVLRAAVGSSGSPNASTYVSVKDSSFSLNQYASVPSGDELVLASGIGINEALQVTVSNCSFVATRGAPGLLVKGASSSVVIESSSFSSHTIPKPWNASAVVLSVGGSVYINSTTFSNNRAMDGGALTITTADSFVPTNVLIEACQFVSNTALESGGAIFSDVLLNVTDSSFQENIANNAGAIMTDSIVSSQSIYQSNTASNQGGAIVSANLCRFSACQFLSNQATSSAGAIAMPLIALRTLGSITVHNSTFDSNSVQSEGVACNGGAVMLESSLGVFVDTIFTNNKACVGGAVWSSKQLGDDPLLFERCNFEDNSASTYGGAISQLEGHLWLLDSSFSRNSGGSTGAVHAAGSRVNATNTSFVSNSASSGGGAALHLSQSVQLRCTACTFSLNSAAANGGAIYAQHQDAVAGDDGTGTRSGGSSKPPEALLGAPEMGTIELFDSVCEQNTAEISGGCLCVMSLSSVTTTIERCSFQSNKATSGGALVVSGGTVSNSNFTDNQASGIKGGVINVNTAPAAQLNVSGSVFSKNQGGPGSLYNAISIGSGKLSLTNCVQLEPPGTLLVQNDPQNVLVAVLVANTNQFLDTPLPAEGILYSPLAASPLHYYPPTTLLEVQAIDYCGANMTIGGGADTISVSATPGSIKAAITDNRNGTYDAVLPITGANLYSATLQVNGVRSTSKAVSFFVDPGPVSPSGCRATITNSTLYCGFTLGWIDIVAADQWGNINTTNVISFTVVIMSATDPESEPLVFNSTSHSGGHYFAVYNSTEAGDFLAHIFLNAQFQISDSPYPFSVAPTPIAPQQTRFSQPGNAVAGAGIACEITLVNMDNTTSTAEQPLLCLSGELIGPANYQAINVTFDRQLQVYRFLFAPLVAGSYKFVATYQGTQLGDPKKSWTVSIVAGEPAGENSTVSGSLLTGGPADQPYELNVALRDEYLNACPCSLAPTAPTATLTHESSHIAFALACSDDQKGIWSGNHTLEVEEGMYLLVVTLGSEEIGAPNGYNITFAPPQGGRHRKVEYIVLAVVIALVLLVLLLGTVFFVRRRYNAPPRRNNARERQPLLPEFNPPDLATKGKPKVSVADLLNDPAITKIPWSEIAIEDKLGIGAGGIVSAGRWRGRPVAVKEIHFGDWTFANDPAMSSSPSAALAGFLVEIKLCSVLRHPNIVEFIGVTSPNGRELCLVSELMARGSVADLLAKKGKNIPLAVRIKLALDAACGMAFLHSCNVIHRDLKPANLLVNDAWVCKIADFGIATIKAGATQQAHTMTVVGTPVYMAPEVLDHERYSEKADCYSFGILLWQMYTTELPYYDFFRLSQIKLIEKIVKEGLRPTTTGIPTAIKELMERCWDRDPDVRPTVAEVQRQLEEIYEMDLKDTSDSDSTTSLSVGDSAVVGMSDGFEHSLRSAGLDIGFAQSSGINLSFGAPATSTTSTSTTTSTAATPTSTATTSGFTSTTSTGGGNAPTAGIDTPRTPTTTTMSHLMSVAASPAAVSALSNTPESSTGNGGGNDQEHDDQAASSFSIMLSTMPPILPRPSSARSSITSINSEPGDVEEIQSGDDNHAAAIDDEADDGGDDYAV